MYRLICQYSNHQLAANKQWFLQLANQIWAEGDDILKKLQRLKGQDKMGTIYVYALHPKLWHKSAAFVNGKWQAAFQQLLQNR